MTQKIFVVLPCYDYEGYGEPEGAFTTRELADAFVKQQRKRGYSGRKVAGREVVETDLFDSLGE